MDKVGKVYKIVQGFPLTATPDWIFEATNNAMIKHICSHNPLLTTCNEFQHNVLGALIQIHDST